MFTHCAAQPRQEGKEDEKIHGLLQKYSDAFPITVNLIYRQLVWMMRNKDKTNTMSYPHPPWLNFPSSEGSTSHQEVQKDWELGKVCLGHNSCPSFSYLSNAPVGPLQASFPSENLLLCGASTGYNSCQESAPQATIPVGTAPCSCLELPEVPFLPCGATIGPILLRRTWGLYRPQLLPGIVPIYQHLILTIFTNPSAHRAASHLFSSPHHSSWPFLPFISHVRGCQCCCWLCSGLVGLLVVPAVPSTPHGDTV